LTGKKYSFSPRIAGIQKTRLNAEKRIQSLFREGVGLMAGIGPAIVGGAGNFMGAGKIMNVGDGADIGVEQGNAVAFLSHFGLPESAGREYQSKLAEGGTLVAVLVEDQKMATSVRTIFEENHGQEISEV
jgi:hypothetical protein